jgi:luciferase family oxidoreductase group 1
VAEQFGTLATLYPGRIDLGLGRAPGTDGPTMRALRRSLARDDGLHEEDRFPRDVVELMGYLAAPRDGPPAAVRAIPGQGTEVPVWLLGSSLYSAQLAAHLGLPFAFASHFAPDLLLQALEIYRATYRPSARGPRPHAMVAVNVVCAPTDDEAAYRFTSLQQRFLGMRRGQRGPLPRPVPPEQFAAMADEAERLGVERMLAVSAVGRPDRVAERLAAIVRATGADELILAGAIHDHAARRRSYGLVRQAFGPATDAAAAPPPAQRP